MRGRGEGQRERVGGSEEEEREERKKEIARSTVPVRYYCEGTEPKAFSGCFFVTTAQQRCNLERGGGIGATSAGGDERGRHAAQAASKCQPLSTNERILSSSLNV